MATLLPHQVDDLVETTIDRNQKTKWVDISLDNQHHIVAERFMRQKKTPVKGGIRQKWRVQVDNQGNFRFTGLFSRDQTGVTNVMKTAQQDWAMWTTNWSYDLNEDEFQGDDATQIIELVLAREHSCFNEMFDQMENNFWTAPSSDSQDPLPISGVPLWLQSNATEGFNGGDPSGFSSGAGNLLGSTYARWKNYTFTWSKYTDDDIAAKWRKAVSFCKFTPPHKFPELGGGMPQWGFYTVYDVVESLGRLLNSRNDNLTDIAGLQKSSDGRPMFQSVPVDWVPVITHSGNDAYDSTSPLYGINWNTMKFFFKRGREMRRHKAKQNPLSHNVRDMHIDGECNLYCENRRANFRAYLV